jgi:hypothetical protein
MKYLKTILEFINFGTIAMASLITVLVLFIMAVIEDGEHLQEIKNDNFERVDSVTLVDIHGNIIIIEENGKYTRFFRKDLE